MNRMNLLISQCYALPGIINKKRKISRDEVIKIVESVTGVSFSFMQTKSRKGAVKNARHLAMVLTYQYTQHSMEEAGALFGRKHSTVHCSLKYFNNSRFKGERFHHDKLECINKITELTNQN